MIGVTITLTVAKYLDINIIILKEHCKIKDNGFCLNRKVLQPGTYNDTFL